MAPLVYRFIFLFFTAAVMLPPLVAFAEDEKPAEEMKAPEIDPEVAKQEKRIVKTSDMIEALTKDLSVTEQKHFHLIQASYNLMATVKMVQEDVESAVKECGKNNPDLKEAMDARYKEWNTAIKPVMEEAEGHNDNMIKAQDYVQASEIRKILKEMDRVRDKSDKQIEKIPVTTPEACEYLRNKMDETQDSMLKLLRATMLPFSQVFPEDEIPEKGRREKDEADAPEPAAGDEAKADEPAAD